LELCLYVDGNWSYIDQQKISDFSWRMPLVFQVFSCWKEVYSRIGTPKLLELDPWVKVLSFFKIRTGRENLQKNVVEQITLPPPRVNKYDGFDNISRLYCAQQWTGYAGNGERSTLIGQRFSFNFIS